MPSGPFSGVNETLGIVALLEEENRTLRERLAKREQETAMK
jgi:hypothetical protein